MPKSTFRIFNFDAFNQYIQATAFQRRITCIQNHHTWKPSYAHFNFQNPTYMAYLENMRHDHIHNRRWSDIGQHLTIFPDGTIGLCRPIDLTPAGILGANTGSICIENYGNFDEGGDQMTLAQRAAIIKTNAALCIKFGLKPMTHQVVYHHWYNTKGKRFSSAEIDSGKVLRNQLQKTCPGTNFFCAPGAPKGNTIECAIANFYPLIREEMEHLQRVPVPLFQPVAKRVKAGILNVRAGRGTDFTIVRRFPKGMLVQVFEVAGDWCRVSASGEEWVNARFLS
jgi:hypothetical protein